MQLAVTGFDLRLSQADTRLPFRFGAVTMTRAPILVAEARIRTEDGRQAIGHAGDLLVPRWFDKDPDKSVERNWADLVGAAHAAGTAFAAAAPATAFDLWHGVYRERVGGTPVGAASRLVRGFGVALCERALIDAACRAARVPFFAALRDDLLGIRLDAVHPELAGWALANDLPAEPARSVQVRHTVGMADPLRADDIATTNRLDDGLPQALEEDLDAYGIGVLKVKIGSGHDSDLARLLDLAALLRGRGDRPLPFTLDGNEQFEDLADLARLLRSFADTDDGRWLLDELLFIEQPLHRRATFDPARHAALADVNAFAPLILDEADHGIEAFPAAIELGYRGVSVKNCKGVFRALINRGLCATREGGLFQSAEDLTNLAVLPLQQDLATVAALGLPHVERNGHHYFHGLAHLPADEARSALEHHPDLYVDDPRTGPRLRIEAGRLQLGSLQCAGYGHLVPVDMAAREPAVARANAWRGAEETP